MAWHQLWAPLRLTALQPSPLHSRRTTHTLGDPIFTDGVASAEDALPLALGNSNPMGSSGLFWNRGPSGQPALMFQGWVTSLGI